MVKSEHGRRLKDLQVYSSSGNFVIKLSFLSVRNVQKHFRRLLNSRYSTFSLYPVFSNVTRSWDFTFYAIMAQPNFIHRKSNGVGLQMEMYRR